MTTTDARPGPSMRLYVGVWLGLILIVAAEVLLAYAHLRPAILLMALLVLVLALVEAGAALLVFMHLKYERPTLFWSLIPALIFVLVLMDHLWPDALRLTSLRAP